MSAFSDQAFVDSSWTPTLSTDIPLKVMLFWMLNCPSQLLEQELSGLPSSWANSSAFCFEKGYWLECWILPLANLNHWRSTFTVFSCKAPHWGCCLLGLAYHLRYIALSFSSVFIDEKLSLLLDQILLQPFSSSLPLPLTFQASQSSFSVRGAYMAAFTCQPLVATDYDPMPTRLATSTCTHTKRKIYIYMQAMLRSSGAKT